MTAKPAINADEQIAKFVSAETAQSFFLLAGAGSGKTRSLVEALRFIRRVQGLRLAEEGRQVAVVTYTNAASDEIKRRLEFDSIFEVSTIHSFCWRLVKGFDSDIRAFLHTHLRKSIRDLQDEESKGRAGTKASAERLAKIASRTKRLNNLDRITSFTYSTVGENRTVGSLSHNDVISVAASFLKTKPVMQRLVASSYPIVFVDEVQDTNRQVLEGLFALEQAKDICVVVGLFGDTMQRIYADGLANLRAAVPPTWKLPEKDINYRSPRRVVTLINRIRQPVDGHQQTAASAENGHVRFFVSRADHADKTEVERKARTRMAEITGDAEWNSESRCKILILEHHMAAQRFGFATLFRPLYEVEDLRTGLLEGSLPSIRLFTEKILPLLEAHEARDKFAIAQVVKEHSPLFNFELDDEYDQTSVIVRTREAVEHLCAIVDNGPCTLRAVLDEVHRSGLFEIPEGLAIALQVLRAESQRAEDENASTETEALIKFLDASFDELRGYSRYVSKLSPFGTHQGIKGLEFDRVMVLMDDQAARGFAFKYESLFNPQPRKASKAEDKETTEERTLRLFYVTCSRAKKSLALVAYSDAPGAVSSNLVANGWFESREIEQLD